MSDTFDHLFDAYDKIVRFISDKLAEAKVSNVSQLIGMPVEVSFEDRTITDWRILTEVI